MNKDFLSVIADRHCKRSFLNSPVERGIIEQVLIAARQAPSPRNTQFWQVAVLTGQAREELSRRMCAGMESDRRYEPDYVNRPSPMGEVHEQRSAAWGSAYYSAMGIARDDNAGRTDVERRNLCFYGAPVAMIFHLPRNAVNGTFLEMGLFLQNVMIGLVACGLGSCPQYSVTRYSSIIREFLGLRPERLIVCSLSIGYVDESAPINRFFPERAALHEYAQWYDHPASGPTSA